MCFMSSISYGTCPCSGVFEPRFVEVTMKPQGRNVVLTGVPQGACPNCGSHVYKAEVLELLESVMKMNSLQPGMTSGRQ
jgi:YgiT-type zinc finger domain-containing protein